MSAVALARPVTAARPPGVRAARAGATRAVVDFAPVADPTSAAFGLTVVTCSTVVTGLTVVVCFTVVVVVGFTVVGLATWVGAAAFGIDVTWTGIDLCDTASPLRLEGAPRDEPGPVVRATPRIGIAYADAPWTEHAWRFVIEGHPSASGPASLR